MSHYAKVLNGKVINVIVAEEEFFDNFVDTEPGTWIQTSYNTKGGVHLDGGTPLRYNYSGFEFNYDSVADAFYPPKPYDSWVLNTDTYLWDCPVVPPSDDGRYNWNEADQSWDAV